MSRLRTVSWVTVLGAACVAFITGSTPSEADDRCEVSYSLDAYFVGSSYEHVVHLESHCDVPVECEVKEIGREAIQVTVPPDESVSVIVDRNANSPDFDAVAHCAPAEPRQT